MVKVIVAPEVLIGNPDLNAMLQAYYSRSHTSIQERLVDFSPDGLDADKIRKSLESWWINYGHDSIGDCGNITLYIEGVSMLMAKAIQDSPLYNGQETSSRFIDFSNQLGDAVSDDGSHRFWLQLYTDAKEKVAPLVAKEFPNLNEKAVMVKTFDIVRGLLPMTAATQLSWTGSIRDIRRHVARLLAHPYGIVRDQAKPILTALNERYPDLFKLDLEPDEKYDWFLEPIHLDSIHLVSDMDYAPTLGEINNAWTRIAYPKDTNHLQAKGVVDYSAWLDYGSYRDSQRHRGSYNKSTPPMDAKDLTEWDLDSFYGDWIQRAGVDLESFLGDQMEVMPLMKKVKTLKVATIDQWDYEIKLRTAPSVHPTAREYYSDAGNRLQSTYNNLKTLGYFRVNIEKSDYNRRAKADITKKG